MVFNCTAEKILHDGKQATALQTNQGRLSLLPHTKLILAMSTLPATTLVLNSFNATEFPHLSQVGKRFTAHFVSSVVVRLPQQHLTRTNNPPRVELGAMYIAGMKDGAQYHLQLSGVSYTQGEAVADIHGICKKYSANTIPEECIDLSRDSVVVSCSALGELDYKNKNNQFYLTDNEQCLTTNGKLKFCPNEQDTALWNWMDGVTFQIMRKLSSSADSSTLEYWHESDKTWKREPPTSEQIRKKSLVHEASTMWIGDDRDTDAPVGLDYQLRGVHNVYITGGALWPTGGSWNPVLTIVAMAMHLADTVSQRTSHTAAAELSHIASQL